MAEPSIALRPMPAGPNPGTVPAICHRCGGAKKGPLVPCKACGYTPAGDDRAVAWLFSGHHLDEPELTEAARRVRAGEQPEPSRALRELARASMGAVPLDDDARRPLSTAQLLALVVTDVVLTPLAGYAVWFGLRENRPVAARQALLVTVPVTLVFTVLWGLVVLIG
jgi:hypothetical protein